MIHFFFHWRKVRKEIREWGLGFLPLPAGHADATWTDRRKISHHAKEVLIYERGQLYVWDPVYRKHQTYI